MKQNFNLVKECMFVDSQIYSKKVYGCSML
jgi:hypothetical protein